MIYVKIGKECAGREKWGRRNQNIPAFILKMHSIVVAVPILSRAEVQLEDARQMHASYLIVHAPDTRAGQLVTWMVELFTATAVMFEIVAGASEKSDDGTLNGNGIIENECG